MGRPADKLAETMLDNVTRARYQAAVGIQGAKSVLTNATTAVNNSSDVPFDADMYRRIRYGMGSFIVHCNELSQQSTKTISSATDGITGSIANASAAVGGSIDNASDAILDKLKPVSSFMGSTLGTMTGVMKDPIGSVMDLPNTLGNMMDKTNPGLRAKYEATFKKFNVNKLVELPKNVVGSLYHLAKTIDGLLAVPMRIISDLYYGAMAILEEINNFIEELFNKIQEFFTNIIDGLFPGLLDFLTELSAFANQVSGIVSVFAGANSISGTLNMAAGAANSLNGFIQNPLNLAFAYLPSQVSQGLYVLNNPQALINQFLPPELSQWMSKVSAVTGFGFNGNMGYGFASVLAGFRNGILQGILDGFGSQFGILAPLLNNSMQVAPSFEPKTTTAVVPDGATYNTTPTGDKASTQVRKAVVVSKQPNTKQSLNYLHNGAAPTSASNNTPTAAPTAAPTADTTIGGSFPLPTAGSTRSALRSDTGRDRVNAPSNPALDQIRAEQNKQNK